MIDGSFLSMGKGGDDSYNTFLVKIYPKSFYNYNFFLIIKTFFAKSFGPRRLRSFVLLDWISH